MSKSDGSTADYYVLPEGATQLQDLISHRNMNAQIGEIFRAGYRYGMASHSDMLRDAKKIRFYAQAEVERLEKLSVEPFDPMAMPIVSVEPSHIISDIPSWDDAPEWAMWVGSDMDGWYWFSSEPLEKCEGVWFGGQYSEVEQEGFVGKDDETLPLAKYQRPTSTAK